MATSISMMVKVLPLPATASRMRLPVEVWVQVTAACCSSVREEDETGSGLDSGEREGEKEIMGVLG